MKEDARRIRRQTHISQAFLRVHQTGGCCSSDTCWLLFIKTDLLFQNWKTHLPLIQREKKKKKIQKTTFIEFVYHVQIQVFLLQASWIHSIFSGNSFREHPEKLAFWEMKLMGQNWFTMKYSSSQEIKVQSLLPSGEGNTFVGHSRSNYLKVILSS